MESSMSVLFWKYAKTMKFGEAIVFSYIQEATEVAPSVVEQWLKGFPPSSGIQKRVFGCLQNARIDDFRKLQQASPAPKKPEKPTKPNQRKKQPRSFRRNFTIQHNAEQLEKMLASLREME
jgi:hypothetical protein